MFFPFQPSSQNYSLPSANIQLKVELSKAYAKIYDLEQTIIKKNDSHKQLMHRVCELKKRQRTLQKIVDKFEPKIPAMTDAVQIRKVFLHFIYIN